MQSLSMATRRTLYSLLFGSITAGILLLVMITPVVSQLADAAALQAITVSISPGITQADANAAVVNQGIRDQDRIYNVIGLIDSGGSASQGERPSSLKLDLRVDTVNNQTSFQYFSDVKNDWTPGAYDCGDVRIHVYVGSTHIYQTGWLGYEGRNPPLPLQTSKITLSHLPSNVHYLTLQPEARIGGCNTGDLISWGGTLVVFKPITSNSTQVTVPTDSGAQ